MSNGQGQNQYGIASNQLNQSGLYGITGTGPYYGSMNANVSNQKSPNYSSNFTVRRADNGYILNANYKEYVFTDPSLMHIKILEIIAGLDQP